MCPISKQPDGVYQNLATVWDIVLKDGEWCYHFPEGFEESVTNKHEVTAFFLGMLLPYYVETGHPDLVPVRSPIRESQTKNAKKLRRMHKNHSRFDVVNVGYNFKEGRIFYKDQWGRKGHWRWQPHGPGRTLRKRIFVEETICKPQYVKKDFNRD